MIQLNFGEHAVPFEFPLWTEIPQIDRQKARWARRQAVRISNEMPSANRYFRKLPKGRSLSELLSDREIWVNYAPTLPPVIHGMADPFGNRDFAIGPHPFRLGRWMVLATFIHELAHINGVPAFEGKQAEEAVLACGLGRKSELTSGIDDPRTPYNPIIFG